MMTTTYSQTQPSAAQAVPLLTRLQRIRGFWQQYWPLIFIGIGAIWLAISSVMLPVNEWFILYAKFHQAQAVSIHTSVLDDMSRSFWEGYNSARVPGSTDGAQIRLYSQLAFSIYIPLLLILLGTGYYIYWHFSRKTLFDSQLAHRLIFFAALASIWFIWYSLASTTLYISPATSKAGFDGALPIFTLGFWFLQSLVMHMSIRQREDRALAQATREAELAALSAQVNPPFIFHALQQLQASAQAEHLPRTEQSLAQLAGIMQYVLEESRKQITDVSREIDFIRDYLRLQELRLPQRDSIQITTDVDWDGKPAPMVPLLLNPLIENAFKYGISINEACFVRIQLHVANGVLTFRSENSMLPRTDLEKGTGLGLANVRKRLQLAYPKRYKLTVGQEGNTYKVTLNIKLC